MPDGQQLPYAARWRENQDETTFVHTGSGVSEVEDARPNDLEWKAGIMREFATLRAAGRPVPPELYATFLKATNDNYATGPDVGSSAPEFSLPDQKGIAQSLTSLTGANGLLLVFFRSADW